jgi:hypothetical protein
MVGYEFRALPAPAEDKRRRQGREAMAELLSSMGRGGWEYVRTDMVPTEVKGMFGMRRRPMPFLIFRRTAPALAPVEPPQAHRVLPEVADAEVVTVRPRRVVPNGRGRRRLGTLLLGAPQRLA